MVKLGMPNGCVKQAKYKQKIGTKTQDQYRKATPATASAALACPAVG